MYSIGLSMCGNKTKLRMKRSLGFSLIELLVSISIITLVTAAVIARNNSFEGAVLLRNQAYNVAMAIREAQLLAVSSTGETNEIQQYGIHIPNGSSRLVIFRDVNPDGVYNNEDDEIIRFVPLDSRFEIASVVGTNNTITFRRPNFDARFIPDTSSEVIITVRRKGAGGDDTSPGAIRNVTVTRSGQVSVESQ